MILRRFMKHVSDQNWFAVGLDVLVVITGIFLGMQVTDWNEERKQDIQVSDALQDLLLELETGANEWIEEVDQHRARLVDQRRLVVDFSRKTEIADHYDAYQSGLQTMGRYPAVDSFDSVYRELQASGQLQLLDRKLRKAVETYYKEVEFYRGQLDQFRASSMPLNQRMLGEGVYNKYNLDRPGYMRVEFDFVALAENKMFMSDLVLLTRNQMVFQLYRVAVMKAAIVACEDVGRYLKADCNALTVPVEVMKDPLGRLEPEGET